MMNISVKLKKKAIFFLAAALAVVCILSVSSVNAYAEEVGTANTDSINVRSEAVNGELVGSLTTGDQVVINDEAEGSDGNTWYNVSYKNGDTAVTGWVRSDFIDEGVGSSDSSEDSSDETADADSGDTAEGTETYVPVTDNASYVVASSIPEEIYPTGFSLTTVNYEGNEISALKADNSEVYLIYVENADDPTQGKLVVYDMDRSELIPFIDFTTDSGFIVLLNIPSEELLRVSDRFVQTTYAFSSGTMDALQLGQTDDLVSTDVDILDYYYMYGVDQDGTYGWYVYDSVDGTVQRNTVNLQYTAEGTVTDTDEDEEDSGFSITDIPLIILIVAAAVLIILIVLVIVFAVRYRRLVELIDEDEEEDEDKEEENEDEISVTHIRTTRPRRGQKDDGQEVVVNEQGNAKQPESMTEREPESAPVSSAASGTGEKEPGASMGENTMDMYNSFSEALERMAAQESAAASGSAEAVDAAEPSSAPAAAPVTEPSPEAGTADAAQPAGDIPEVTVDIDDDDDDLEFL